MKFFKHFFLLLLITSTTKSVISQNVMLNVLTQNSGIVNRNATIFLEVTIVNTSTTKTVPIYKLRPQINFPSQLVSIPNTGHILPKGWTITSNKDGVVYLSNGSDIIPPTESRTILIAIKGKEIGGPSTISGNLLFSNGSAPGIVTGAPLAGDNVADNSSTSTVNVIK